MKSGVLKHPSLGYVRTFHLNNRPMLQCKVNNQPISQWFNKYDKLRTFEWKYCLFPQSVVDDEEYELNSMKPRQTTIKKIIYSGQYVSSLKDQILTRAKNNAKFSQNQILYITYSIVCAWKEWRQFCHKFNIQNKPYALSSEHVLFNLEGDIKIITPESSPLPYPNVFYYAPQNIPPNMETDGSWNKSIGFSIGLIGAELITLKLANSFYQSKGQNIKFAYEEYQKCLKSCQKEVSKQIFNLIFMLTDKNPWIRLKIGQFQALLSPYHSSILDGQQQKLSQKQSRASLLKYLTQNKR